VAEKTINFKVDAEIYKRIKIQVAEQDTTLKDYVLSLIMKDISNESSQNKIGGTL